MPPEAAGESIGAASAVARTLPDGGVVVAQAASAFTDAFNLANGVAVAIAVAAAAGVLAWSRRRDAEPEPDLDLSSRALRPRARRCGRRRPVRMT